MRQFDVTPEAIAKRKAKEKKEKNPTVGCALLVGVGILLCLGMWWGVFGGGGGSGGGGDRSATKVDACVACDAFVKRELVAPSTADFPPTSKMSISQSGDNFVVAGYVDAENSFGAMLRTRFVCDVTYKGGGVDRLSNWRLEDLMFLE